MGIYGNGSIFGIQIYNFNDDDVSNILFEEKYDEVMSYQQMREAYIFYNILYDKNEIHFKIYTECSSTLSYNRYNFMMWQPLPLDTFLEKFGIWNEKGVKNKDKINYILLSENTSIFELDYAYLDNSM